MSIPLKRSRRLAEGGASTLVRSPHACLSETAAERLTDDLLVEILSRVPAKSICRFKCVSKHWLSLIYDRNHRKVLPQTLEGFLYGVVKKKRSFLESPIRFANLAGSRRPLFDFTFLPNNRHVDLLDCCNGLLLCRLYDISGSDDEFRYIVCNPVTGKWLVLPDDSDQTGKERTVRLGFDPAVSSHFYVFVFSLLLLQEDNHYYHDIAGMHVYSSETGRWTYKEKRWDRDETLLDLGSPVVFLNNYMHFFFLEDSQVSNCVAAVHTEEETWMSFDAPDCVHHGAIQQSQGLLHYVGSGMGDRGCFNQIVVCVLEDYDSKRWVLKHRVDYGYLGWKNSCICEWIALHPDCNLIFLTRDGRTTLMCYNMDRRRAKVVGNLGDGCPHWRTFMEAKWAVAPQAQQKTHNIYD